MAKSVELLLRLPNREIVLRQVDLKDSVTGGFNICNLNFKELSEIYTAVAAVVKEIQDNINIDSLVKNTIERIRTDKLAFTLHYAQYPGGETEKVEYNDSIYEISRVGDTLYVITRMMMGDDLEPWDTSNFITQLKNSEGAVANASIITRENSVMVDFADAPIEDHTLLLL